MFRILYKRMDGVTFVQEANTASFKEDFIAILERAGLQYEVVETEDRKVQLCEVAFSIEDAVLVKGGKKSGYTFADPDRIGKANSLVAVQLESGEQKPVFVCGTRMATISEIREIADKLGRKKLCRVIKKIA